MANLGGSEISVNISDVMRASWTVTLRLTGLRWWMLKSRFALVVIRLGVWLMGANCEVIFFEDSDEEEL